MSGQKKFFLIGGYAYGNPGDTAILKATIARLNAMHPGSHFVIWSDRKDYSPELAAGISSEMYLHRCPWFFAGNRVRPRFVMSIYRLLYPFSQTVVQKIRPGKNRPLVRKMRECDYILFIGGGYINSNYAFELFQMHHLACLAGESGKPVYLLGQTLGPFKNRWHLRIAKTIFRIASRIVLREKYSLPELGEFKEKALDGADEALDFATSPDEREQKRLLRYLEKPDGNGVLMGLNLRSAKEKTDYSQLVKSLNEFNAQFAGGRLKVIFIFMETSRYDDDRKEAALFEKVPGRNFQFEVLPDPLSVESRRWLIARTDIFLGMRFHSLVFALSSGVPCAGLYSGQYYFRKNYGLLEMYGMERYCLKTDKALEITAFLGELLQNKDKIRTQLQTKHEEVIRHQAALYRTLFS